MLEGFSGGLIVAFIDFLMVFLVLGGLAVAIVGLKKVVGYWERQEMEAIPESRQVPEALESPREIKAQIAAIAAALYEFTSAVPGSFRIDTIEPIDSKAEVSGLTKAQIAAIAIAIHEFTSMPLGTFQITRVKPLGKASTWKMAGRLELMGVDV